MPLRYFDSTSFGDILSRLTNDVDAIAQLLGSGAGTLVSSVTLLLGALVMLLVTNALLAGSAILASLVGFAFIVVIAARSQKYFLTQQQSLGRIKGFIEEAFSGQEVIRAANAEESNQAAFDAINATLYESAWKSRFLSGVMMPVMSLAGNLGFVVVCVLGAVMAARGMIDFSVIVSSCSTSACSPSHFPSWRRCSQFCSPPWRRPRGCSSSSIRRSCRRKTGKSTACPRCGAT